DLNKDGKIISKLEFLGNDTGKACDYSCEFTPGLYLYEPNASIMKLAPWAILSDRYPGLKKLGKDSHLFISDSRFDDFPGRVLKIDKTINKKDRKTLKGFPANVVTRNYPLSADNLRKKLGVGKEQIPSSMGPESEKTRYSYFAKDVGMTIIKIGSRPSTQVDYL
ncbi:MAG: hypothetical protein K2O49_06895, partial [Muribaculaceae bacterium]|nr:hypothetical protein [Muribaculaceae bacterium]